LSLGYCSLISIDSWIFQRQESKQLEMFKPPSRGGALPASAYMGLIGRVEIQRLNLSVMVMEGSSDAILRRAAGHIVGTTLPGEPGNVGISAHRDTFFWPLRNVRRDDIITFTTLLGKFRYRVVSTRIVLPTDVSVLNPGNNEVLTLVTCYPFFFIGPAPDRFIVRAERVI
jgi:sortase A